MSVLVQVFFRICFFLLSSLHFFPHTESHFEYSCKCFQLVHSYCWCNYVFLLHDLVFYIGRSQWSFALLYNATPLVQRPKIGTKFLTLYTRSYGNSVLTQVAMGHTLGVPRCSVPYRGELIHKGGPCPGQRPHQCTDWGLAGTAALTQ